MADVIATVPIPSLLSAYNRLAELKAFNETKSGVKGLVDAGIRQIPRIFIHPPQTSTKTSTIFEIPVVDLKSIDKASTVEKVRAASKNLGFFQLVNHGIPVSVMDEVLQGVRRFHGEDPREKIARTYQGCIDVLVKLRRSSSQRQLFG